MQKINWNDVPVEQVNPKMKRQFINGEKIMIAKMEFEDGFKVFNKLVLTNSVCLQLFLLLVQLFLYTTCC